MQKEQVVFQARRVGGGGGGRGGSRGSNKPPKMFEVGIFGGLKRSKNLHKTIK